MSKLKILTQRDQDISIWSNWTRPITSEYFDLIWLEDGTADHSPKDSIVVLRPHKDNYQHILHKYRSLGYRVVIDNMWDQTVDQINCVNDGVLSLYCNKWFWYNESLWYTNLGYDQYQPQGQATKSFLMLMNLRKAHRDKIYQKLQPLLDQGICSYVGKGRHLDNDTDINSHTWQRYFNPSWYDSTKFSVVVETNVNGGTWVTEKTFKPLAYFHPFVAWSTPGTLSHIQSLGFETFGHVIDESYDTETNDQHRLNKVCDIVSDLNQSFLGGIPVFNDAETQKKLQHNHNQFFNTKLVQSGFRDDVIFPLINFIECQ